MDVMADAQDPLARWYERAGVRRNPRRVFDASAERLGADTYVFPPSLVPVTQHPVVQTLGKAARDRLLVEHLYEYLDFTVRFELAFVNVAAERVATDGTGFHLPELARMQAFGVYCDEGYHALYCVDVMKQVEQATGVSCRPDRFASVAGRLEHLLDRVPLALRDTAQLLLVIVFETLVSRILEDVPRDPNVVACVQDVVRDHARDERQHHAYFASLFGAVWPQIDPRDRSALGVLVPDLLHAVLGPDHTGEAAGLVASGLDAETAASVVADTYPEQQVAADICRTARATLNLFARTGVFDDPSTREAFASGGLLTTSKELP